MNHQECSHGVGLCVASCAARRSSPPSVPTDRVRLHVALWRMAQALGLGWTQVDAAKPDHELVEAIASAVTPALAGAFRLGYVHLWNDTETQGGTCYAPYDDDQNIYLNGKLDAQKI